MKIDDIVKRIGKIQYSTYFIEIVLFILLSVFPIAPELFEIEGKRLVYLSTLFPPGFLFLHCISFVEQLKCKKISIVILDLISIILLYTMIYANIYALNPDAFNIANEGIVYLDMLYFSIVTFTTLGYGDITPISYGARFWSASEAFIFTCVIAFLLITYADALKEFLEVYNEKKE